MNERDYEYEPVQETRASTEQIIHAIRARKFRDLLNVAKRKSVDKFYLISSEELDELEQRARG